MPLAAIQTLAGYRIRLTCIQTVEQNIRASDEEEALEKVRAEAVRPTELVWKGPAGGGIGRLSGETILIQPTDRGDDRAP